MICSLKVALVVAGLAFVAPVFPAGATSEQAKVAVFVGPQMRDGFIDIDSGIADSIQDITAEVRKSRILEIAAAEKDAAVVLRVLARRIAGEAGSVGITSPGTTLGGSTIAGVKQPTYTTPGTTVAVPFFRYAIDTTLSVGAYEKPTTSIDENSSWKGAAKQVVKDLTAWVEANRAQLVKR